MPKATRPTAGKSGSSLEGIGLRKKRVQIQPGSPEVEGFEIPIESSTEKWCEYELQDGAVIRIKQVLFEVIRVIGQYDQEGNPIYFTKASPVMNIVSVPDKLKKKVL